jgi:hypothetical protein
MARFENQQVALAFAAAIFMAIGNSGCVTSPVENLATGPDPVAGTIEAGGKGPRMMSLSKTVADSVVSAVENETDANSATTDFSDKISWVIRMLTEGLGDQLEPQQCVSAETRTIELETEDGSLFAEAAGVEICLSANYEISYWIETVTARAENGDGELCEFEIHGLHVSVTPAGNYWITMGSATVSASGPDESYSLGSEVSECELHIEYGDDTAWVNVWAENLHLEAEGPNGRYLLDVVGFHKEIHYESGDIWVNISLDEADSSWEGENGSIEAHLAGFTCDAHWENSVYTVSYWIDGVGVIADGENGHFEDTAIGVHLYTCDAPDCGVDGVDDPSAPVGV